MANIIKAADLVAYVKKAHAEKWGYVFGGQGETYTLELAEKWGKAGRFGMSYDYYTTRCKQWFGHIVVDCSGLIVQAFRSKHPAYGDRTADAFIGQCVETGYINTLPEKPGICLWKPGHIGIYIGNGKAIEARGVNYGVTETAVQGRGWVKWGLLADVDYTVDVVKQKPPVVKFVLGRLLKYVKAKMMRGDDVKELQTALKRTGYDPGPIDGIFGPKTEKAVKAFQRVKGLVVDGIVGPKTAAALGWKWSGK